MDSSILSSIAVLSQFFEQHKIEKAYIFGSATSGNFNKNSDIDLIIKFKPGIPPLERGELWWNLHDTLRDHFNREIDIITENSLKNPYFIKELERSKELIYG